MNQPEFAISAELMARFAECARFDFKHCVERYCKCVPGSNHEATREARSDLQAARWMMDLTRTVEYW